MPTPPTVPGYRAEVLLGRGGHGEVWRGLDLASGRPVALKVLDGAGSRSERLRTEVAAAGALAGPHVLAVLDVCAAGADAVVVTELAGGGSLADVLAARGRLSAGEVVTALAPIGGVLAEAHSRLIVHGDVTPANLLFAATGRPMLADWGLARVMAGVGSFGPGTPGYADPAVLAGAREPDPPADVAGLAAVGYAALTGRPPWQPDRAYSRVDVLRAAPLCPPSLAAAVEAGLAMRPEDRPTAGEFASALSASCDPEPVVLPRRPAQGAARPVTLARPKAATAPTAARGGQRRGRSATSRRGAEPTDRGPDRRVDQALDRRPGRRAVAGVAATVAALAAAGVAAGVLWSRHAQSAATLTQRPSPPAGSRSAPSPPQPAAPDTEAGHRRVSPREVAPPTAAPSAAGVRWQAVLQELAARRATALRRRDPALLDRVYVAGSRAGAADRATVARLRRRGLVPRGLHIRVRAARLLEGAPMESAEPVDPVEPAGAGGASALVDMVSVEMVSTVSSYRLLDAASGSTVDVAPANSGQALRVTLRRTGAGWRIAALGSG